MKKHFVRFLALLLICATFSSAALPVSAAEVSTRASGQTSGLPFTMKPGVNVTSLWTTNRSSGGYNFVPGNITTGTKITLQGTFDHSLSSGVCKAGICVPNGGTYESVKALTRTNGVDFGTGSYVPVLCYLSALDNDTTYYGFVKNNSSSGYVYNAELTLGIA